MYNFTSKRTALAAGMLMLFGLGMSAQTFLHEGIVYKASGNRLAVQCLTAKKKPVPENGTLPEHYSGDIVLPENIEYKGKTYTVAELGSQAFKGEPVTSVVMPNTITKVGLGSFQDCTQLASVTLSTGIAKLQQNMFTNCTSLTEITIPGGITQIPGSFLKGCTALTKLTILDGDGLLDMNANAFVDGGTSALRELYIYHAIDPAKATAMADKPFRGAPALEKVVLGGSVTELNASYFENCPALKTVVFESDVKALGTGVFANTAIEEITLPEGLTTISSTLFANTKKLRKVTLGSAVDGIDALAFQNSAVSEINFPATLTYISEMAFSGTGLSGRLVLPEGLKRIGAQAFANIAGLTELVVPSTTTTIGDGVVMSCPAVAKFEVAAENENYTAPTGDYIASKDLSRILVHAPAAAATTFSGDFLEVAPYAFYNCRNLTEITLPKAVVYGDYAFFGTSIVRMSLTGSIGRYVTSQCPALTEITLATPEIPFGVVAGSKALNKVNLPEVVTVVKQDAFNGATALKSLRLGASLAILEANCFAGSGITDLEVASTFPPAMAEGVFTADCGITATVPASLVDTYKAADGWKNLNIVGDANLVAGGADMGMPAGLYYAGDDDMLHCVYSDGMTDTYDVGGIPHTFQLLEYSNRIYGASAGRKFVYSATGATDGDGKLFYISKVGGQTFQAVVLDNTGNNAYKDPFGLYIYGEDLYVNDRNVCIRIIPASAIALPQNYPSWMENNWMYFYGAPWSYGCIKSGFAITKVKDANGVDEPLYWVGMKYNGNGIFRFRSKHVGTGAGENEKGSKPDEPALFTTLEPIFTTFNIDEANGHLYIYIEKMRDNNYKAGLYRVNLADVEANPDPSTFGELNPVLIDGSPVKYEGHGTNEHVGISQFAFDAEGKYMYWCYRAPTPEEAAAQEGQDEAEASKGKYYWADKYDENNPLHHSGIKRILLGQDKPVVEMVVPGVSGYGVAPVNYEGSTGGSGVVNTVVAQPEMVAYTSGAIQASEDVELSVYDAAGLMVARGSLVAGETFSADQLPAGVLIVVANGNAGTQILKIAK